MQRQMSQLYKSMFLTIIFLLFSQNIYAHQKALSYESYMKLLIPLAKKNPSNPFAAMIIDNQTGKILCDGVNNASINPTYHGEIVAINQCAAKYPKLNWSNTTLITDAEPCSMCASAIVFAGIPKVVYGTSKPVLNERGWNKLNIRAASIFKKAHSYKGQIVGGVLHNETDKLFNKH